MFNKNKSILRKLCTYMMAFGIAMGFIFPVYANIFVQWKEGYFIYFLVGCILAGITVGVVSYSFVKSILIKELLKVSDIAEAISQKDLSKTLDIKSEDAVGKIAAGFNTAISSIQYLLADIENISKATKAITGSKNQLNSGSIAKLNDALKTVNQAASNISNLSENINQQIIQRQQISQSTKSNLLHTQQSIDHLGTTLQLLMANTKKINDLTETVKDIADKTNLLAINASIEAARAGIHGKSFAVVANEVHMLSLNTNESANCISSTIQEINQQTKELAHVSNNISKQNTNNIEENNISLEIANLIDAYSLQNIDENEQLKETIQRLNLTVDHINSTFNTLINTSNQLQNVVNQFITKKKTAVTYL